MQQWFHDHPVISYVVILVLTIYIFNTVFRPGRLPIWKEVVLHLFMAAGAWLLWLLQHDRLPIIACMGGASLLVAIVRIRQRWSGRAGRGQPRKGGESRGE